MDLFDLLCKLIRVYDVVHYTAPDVPLREALSFLMNQHGLG